MISIIIIAWKSADFIENCLRSILQQTYSDYELIIVDNNPDSKDRTIILKIDDHRIKYIANKSNTGFAAGQNLGIRSALGEWVFCLNPDTTLPQHYLSEIYEVIQSIPLDIGMVGTRVLSQNNPNTIDSDGIAMTKHRYYYDFNSGVLQNNAQFPNPDILLGPCACGVFIRKKMVDEISIDNQFFDEDFFCYYEDVDVCWRALTTGWKFIMRNHPVFYHIRSATTSKKSQSFLKMLTFRNRYWVIVKNDELKDILADLPYFLFMEVVNFLKILRYPYLIKAWIQMIRGIPKMALKRKTLNKKRKIISAPKTSGTYLGNSTFFNIMTIFMSE